MAVLSRRPRRSVSLSTSEIKNFKKFISGHPTNYDATLALKISEPTFYCIIKNWSCSQDTYDKLKKIAKI